MGIRVKFTESGCSRIKSLSTLKRKIKSREPFQPTVREREMTTGEGPERDVTLLALEMEKGGHARTKECGQPVEDGKGEEKDFPVESPDKEAALWILAQQGPCQTSAEL